MLGQWPSTISGAHANIVSVCRVCANGLLILSLDIGSSAHPDVTQYVSHYPGTRFKILATWPSIASYTLADVPENVEHYYQQAMENQAAQRWDAAGAMFRKSLDVATKLISPEARTATLFKRIELLVTAGHLTPAMGEWAHEIRLEGNDAVHDETPETHDDVAAMQKFAEAFLTYVFTLPKLVERNRAKRHKSIAA